jgi:hypothetical protein
LIFRPNNGLLATSAILVRAPSNVGLVNELARCIVTLTTRQVVNACRISGSLLYVENVFKSETGAYTNAVQIDF